MKPHHLYIILTLLLLSTIPSSQASLSAPGTWHPGHKLSGSFWDMWGENGLRNGTLGGVGNNVTFLDGSGVTFLPISGTTSDLDMNGKNITNVRVVNSTQVNVTTVNATNIQGNGSGIFNLNASNLTNPISAINGSALFGLNMSNQTTCRGNMTCTYNANGSVSLDAVSNLTAIFNRVLNSSTVTAGVYANGSMELTATATATAANNTTIVLLTANSSGYIVPQGVYKIWVTLWGGGGGGSGRGGTSSTTGGTGGDSGEVIVRQYIAVTPGQNISFSIGNGGGGGAVGVGVTGKNGTPTNFSTFVAMGGLGGGYQVNASQNSTENNAWGTAPSTSFSNWSMIFRVSNSGGGYGSSPNTRAGNGAPFGIYTGGLGGISNSINGGGGGGAAGFYGSGGKGGGTDGAATAAGVNSGAGGGGGFGDVGGEGYAGGSGGIYIEYRTEMISQFS